MDLCLMNKYLQEVVKKSKKSALIPTLPDSRKEEKMTSILLSVFSIAPRLAVSVLEGSNLPNIKAPKIVSFIEVKVEDDAIKDAQKKDSRPDGLLIIKYKGNEWSAFIESKVGNNEIEESQIVRYIDLAKKFDVDAVITFSNQFASTPSHHPLNLSKSKLKGVGLYHYSWLSVLAKSIEAIEKAHVDDPEQSYIISELIRYMDSKDSNVAAELRMSNNWKDVIEKIQKNIPVNKTDRDVEEAVAAWHQLQRYLALQLSRSLNEPVKQYLTRSRASDPAKHLKEDIDDLITSQSLSSEFDIPNAAARLQFKADLAKRNITLSMKLDAPSDKKQATASINWLTRQLKDSKPDHTQICAHWPKRIPATHSSLTDASDDANKLVPAGLKEIPTYLEPYKVVDLAAKFSTPKKFVEIVEVEVIDFYRNIGQYLNKWSPKPPKVKSSTFDQEEVDDNPSDDKIETPNTFNQEQDVPIVFD